MNVDSYKRRLLEIEDRLSQRATGERDAGREQLRDSAGDAGDASVEDESESEDFTEAEQDADVLQQVRGALQRIEEGTFGRCAVDGGPIEEKRLEAVPWTPYCLKHQQQLEAQQGTKTPTL
jgi:DnaK suppressor protein